MKNAVAGLLECDPIEGWAHDLVDLLNAGQRIASSVYPIAFKGLGIVCSLMV